MGVAVDAILYASPAFPQASERRRGWFGCSHPPNLTGVPERSACVSGAVDHPRVRYVEFLSTPTARGAERIRSNRALDRLTDDFPAASPIVSSP